MKANFKMCASLVAGTVLSIFSSTTLAQQEPADLRPAVIDCANAYPETIEAAVAQSGLVSEQGHVDRLEFLLSALTLKTLPEISDEKAREIFSRLAVLSAEGQMISAEIVHLQAMASVPAWKESLHAQLFTRMLQTVYEPYHPDGQERMAAFPSKASKAAQALDEVDAEFNDALMLAKSQVLAASKRVPGFFERPVRWFIQGVVYHDPIARQYAAGQLCAHDAFHARIPVINEEVGKIAP